MTSEFWCRACSGRTDDVDDRNRPRGWYRLVLARPEPPGEGDVRPGWYCSSACVCFASMTALGISSEDAWAWLRSG